MKSFNTLFIFVQKIDFGYTFHDLVLTSTHSLCFGGKIVHVCACMPQYCHIKVGCRGVYFLAHLYEVHRAIVVTSVVRVYVYVLSASHFRLKVFRSLYLLNM